MSTPAPSLPVPPPHAETAPSGAEVLFEAARRQRERVLSAATAIRLGGSVLLLLISLVLWRVADNEDWSAQVPALIAYSALALVTFIGQGRAAMVRLAWVQPLLDVGFAYALLRTSILIGAASAQSMAGLGVAVLLLPVAFAGLAFRTRTLVMVTLGAAMADLSLMAQTGRALWPMIASTAVLLLAAAGSKLARETVEAEITRRLLAETRVRCAELSHLQEEKDELLGIIVHEMRTPVNTTLLSLEYLEGQMRRRDAGRAWMESVADALASCSVLSDLIEQILDTTKLESKTMTLQLAVLDACRLLEQARDHTLTHARSKSIALELDAQGPLLVSADPRLLLRAFECLIGCSIDQTPAGGRILLHASKTGEEARIATHRSGAPIPLEQRDALFEKSRTGECAGPRLARWRLGLYFCRLMAEAQGAKLTAESTEGWAASYVMRLPLLPGSRCVAASGPSDSPRTSPG